MLALYRAALASRRASPALRMGRFEWLEGAPDSVVAFTRTSTDETVTAVVNMSDEPVRVDVAGQVLVSSEADVRVADGCVTLPYDSAAWISSTAERRE
jgi:alpha-glucosidase